MTQTAVLRFLLGMILGLAVFLAGLVGQAYAHPTARYLARTTLRVHGLVVLGHHVRECSWRPGDAHIRGLVRYSRVHLLTVPGWARAGQRRSRAVCAINAGTYRTASPGAYRPSGTVYAGGRRIRGVTDAPAVGFAGGHVYFGAQNAYRHGARNITNGLAQLVQNGRALASHADAPWTTRAQYSCGAPGTDGVYGCSRSSVVSFRGGRVGLVEIGHASMRLAARILVRMGVRGAVTLDSGGAALLWTLPGAHNTGSRTQVGHLFGATVGSAWKRRLPYAIVVNARRL